MADQEAESEKAVIYIFPGLLAQTVDRIEEVLLERDAGLFQHNGAIYWRPAEGPPRKATAQLLRLKTAQVAEFLRPARRSGYEGIDPPLKYFEALLRKGEWKFPILPNDKL